MNRRRAALTLYALVATAWALRVHRLGASELWFDEAASYFIAAKDWLGILRYVVGAPFEHPPLYYLLLHAVMPLFGISEWSLRFPSALLSTIFVAALWRFSRSFAGDRPALVAASLATVSPFLVTYGREARMYALLQCLGLVATYLLFRLAAAPRPRLWLLYAATAAAGLATHYFFAFLLAAHVLMLLVLRRPKSRALLHAIVAVALTAGGLALWLAAAPGLRMAAAQMWREALWGKSWRAIGDLFVDWAYGGAIISTRPAWAPLPAAALATLAALGLLYRPLAARHRVALAAWALVPAACAIVIPYGGLVLRHFSYVAPALYLLVGAGLLYLGHRGVLPLIAGIAALTASVLPGLIWQSSLDKGDYGRALAYVRRYAQPGDLLLFLNPHQWVLAQYYNRTGLPTANVGAGWPVPAEQLAQAERVWVMEWETWALTDTVNLRHDLWQSLYPAESRDYSADLSLHLLYAAPKAHGAELAGGRWDDGRQLARALVSAGALRPGQAARVQLRWRPDPSLATTTALALRLVGGDGRTWAEQMRQPSTSESADGTAHSNHALIVPGGTPPGEYVLELAAIDLPSSATLSATAADGTALGPWVRLGTVQVERGSYPLPEAPAGQPARLEKGLSFLGSESDATMLTAGARWQAILQFSAEQVPAEVRLRFSLRGRGGERDLGEVPLGTTGLRASEWRPGEAWRCPYDLRLPADLPSGQYELIARAFEGDRQLRPPGSRPPWPFGRESVLLLDVFRVTARPPHMVVSRPSRPLDAVFSGQIRLLGYDLEESEGRLKLRLYWQALGPTGEPRKVFVHLTADGDGQPLAQDDAPPGDVPTTDWLSGESYLSEHVISLPELEPAKRYVLRVGLYDERTMVRQPASGASASADHVLLPLSEPD